MKTKVLGRVKGADGHNFCVGANVNSVSDLPAANTVPSGTHYYVGASAPREVYFSDGSQWINQGYMYKRDNDSVGSTYKEKLNFDLSQIIPNGYTSELYSLDYMNTDMPDLIIGSIVYLDQYNSTEYLSEFRLVMHDELDDGSVGRIFYSDSTMVFGSTDKIKSANLLVVTGPAIAEMAQEEGSQVQAQNNASEYPKKVFMLEVNKYQSSDVIKAINLEAVYCIAK